VPKSRRKAREAALQALYELEVGKKALPNVLRGTLEANELSGDLAAYAETLIVGVREKQAELDDRLAAIIREYDFDRIAAVDRNVMRMTAYELFFLPSVPPAVSINEAVEIAKKFSTAESGKFVNGVLGRLLKDSPKANWDPATAPKEEFEEEIVRDSEPQSEEETLTEGSEELEQLAKVGAWKLRSEDMPRP
jgi:N utilization substance protein B